MSACVIIVVHFTYWLEYLKEDSEPREDDVVAIQIAFATFERGEW